MSDRTSRSFLHLLVIPFVFIVLRCLYPLEQLVDFKFWDETLYLDKGLRWHEVNLDWAPLYSFHYHLLSRVFDDPIVIYYVNACLLIVGVLLLSSWVVHRLTRSLALSFLAGFSYLFFGIVWAWPYVNHFASLIILLVFALLLQLRSTERKLGLALIASYVLVLIRPEYFVTFYALFFFLVGSLVFRVRHEMKAGASFLSGLKSQTVTALSLLITLAIAVPLHIPTYGGSARQQMALGQNYSLNLRLAGRLQGTPWLSWQEPFKRDFGSADSVAGVLLANPSAFLWHVGQNLVHLFELRSMRLALAILVIGMLLLLLRRSRLLNLRAKSIEYIEGRHLDALLILGFFAPIVIAISLIHPRPHYIVTVWTFLLLLWSAYIPPLDSTRARRIDGVLAAMLLLLVGMNPPEMEDPMTESRKRLELVQKLRVFERTNPLGGVIEVDGGLCVYLESCERDPSPAISILRGTKMSQLDSIVVSPMLLEIAGGTPFLHIIENPGKYGYSKYKLSETHTLLHRPRAARRVGDQ